MILRLFKQSYFAQIALLIVLSIIIWLPAFIKPYPVLISDSNIFTEFIFSQNLIINPLIGVLLGFLLILTEAFLISYLFSIHQITHRNNFLSGFLFVLFLSRTPEHLGFHPPLIAILFLLLGLEKLLENFKSPRNHNNTLTASIWFSVASLFIPSVILLFPIIWISLIIFLSFNRRSIPISLVGIIIPYFIIAFAYFWSDKSLLFIEQIETIFNSLLSQPKLPGTYELVELFVAATLIFISSSFILTRLGNQVISIRKKASFMYWFLGIGIIISFFSQDSNARDIVFIPFAAVLGFYFSAIKRQFWADLFISIIFVSILIQNYRIIFYA
ncbi:MAG: hypothetical protein PF484_09535 [Bacteroidales bacterium]|jgi:hypothetical protein|nr:hypothetical protein [Bacteroidales bacterium]